MSCAGEAPGTLDCCAAKLATLNAPALIQTIALNARIGYCWPPATVGRLDRSAVIRDAWTSVAVSAICYRILSDECQLAA